VEEEVDSQDNDIEDAEENKEEEAEELTGADVDFFEKN